MNRIENAIKQTKDTIYFYGFNDMEKDGYITFKELSHTLVISPKSIPNAMYAVPIENGVVKDPYAVDLVHTHHEDEYVAFLQVDNSYFALADVHITQSDISHLL